ncbi:MAG: DUF4124 domain-containing protein [Nitrosospira sp.]|nr:DUF4124 domain-containing protein [Nitrosospira sp.]
MRHLMLSVLLFSFSLAAHGQFYKWVDKNGTTQYSDQPPPPGVVTTEQKLNIKSRPAQPGAGKTSAPAGLAEKELEFKKRRAAEEKTEIERQAEAERNKERCIQANSKLKVFRDSPRVSLPDGAGGVVFADDVARQKGIDEAQKEISAYCR